MQGTLVIKPLNGDLTRNTDLFTKMDPYVKLYLGAQHKETRVARKEGKHPVWRDELTLQYDTHDDILHFEVWDEDTHKKDDLVGTGSLAVATIQQKGNKMQEWIKLSYKGKYAGEILVDISFVPDNMMNQQNQNMMMMSNNMQAMPNQMMQSTNYQNVYPMMSASQQNIQRPQYQQQNSFQQQPTYVTQNSYVTQGSMPQEVQLQPELVQQIQVQPQYQQQNSFQQQQQQQPIYVKQNSYAHHYPAEQVYMQEVPHQMQMQQEIPQQVYVQEMPIQQGHSQQHLYQKSYSFAPPIERASTMNRTQLRARTQIDQRGQSSQGTPNQFDNNFFVRGA